VGARTSAVNLICFEKKKKGRGEKKLIIKRGKRVALGAASMFFGKKNFHQHKS